MEGSGRGLIQMLSSHLPGGNKEDNENRCWEQPVSRPNFEPGTSRIQIKALRFEPECWYA